MQSKLASCVHTVATFENTLEILLVFWTSLTSLSFVSLVFYAYVETCELHHRILVGGGGV